MWFVYISVYIYACTYLVFALGRAQELLLILDEYWKAHPELHNVPIYYASSLAKKCMTIYQTYVHMMNEKYVYIWYIYGSYKLLNMYVYIYNYICRCVRVVYIFTCKNLIEYIPNV